MCDIQYKSIETNITKIKFVNKAVEVFINTIANSNFEVLKCYKLPFNFKTFSKNIGQILMTIIYIINLFFLMIYCIKEKKKISFYLKSILKKYFVHSSKKKN